MAESKKLPTFQSVRELVDFFDAHDMSEYWDQMPEAKFEVEIKRRTRLVAIDGELADKLAEFARMQETSSEALLNSWLREKLQQES